MGGGGDVGIPLPVATLAGVLCVDNYFQKVAHRVVSSIANDLRENTLTNAISIPLGAVRGGYTAYKAATMDLPCYQEVLLKKLLLERRKGLQ